MSILSLLAACTLPRTSLEPAAPPAAVWEEVSVPVAWDATTARLVVEAGGRQVVDPAWVCVAAVDELGQPQALPAPVTLTLGDGPGIAVPSGRGCAAVAAGGTGPRTLRATGPGGLAAEVEVEVVGRGPLQELPGDPEARVTQALPDLHGGRPDPTRNATFTLLLTPEATVGQLQELLRARDAVLLRSSTLGPKAFLSVAAAAPSIELGALLEAAGRFSAPFVEMAAPDTSVPADRMPGELPEVVATPVPESRSFAGPYPEFAPAPGAVAVGPARALVVKRGAPGRVAPTDEVRLRTRSHVRGGRLVTRTEATAWLPWVQLDPVQAAVVKDLGVGGAARIWTRPGEQELLDVELLEVRPATPAPATCEGPLLQRWERLCVRSMEPGSDRASVEVGPGAALRVVATPVGCYSSSATEVGWSTLHVGPDGAIDAGICLAPPTGVLRMGTADCGGAGVAMGAVTIAGPGAVLSLGETSLEVPARLPPGGVCSDGRTSDVPERPLVPELHVTVDGPRFVTLVRGEQRWPLASGRVEVPAGVYHLYADFGGGERFAGVLGADRNRRLACDPGDCRCGDDRWIRPDAAPGACAAAPLAAPPPEPAPPPGVDGPWSALDRATRDAMPAGGVTCVVVDPADGGAATVEGCGAPFADWARAWAEGRASRPETTRDGRRVEARTPVRWRSGDAPPALVYGPSAPAPAPGARPVHDGWVPAHCSGRFDRAALPEDFLPFDCRLTAEVGMDGHAEVHVDRCPEVLRAALTTSVEEGCVWTLRDGPLTYEDQPFVATFELRVDPRYGWAEPPPRP